MINNRYLIGGPWEGGAPRAQIHRSQLEQQLADVAAAAVNEAQGAPRCSSWAWSGPPQICRRKGCSKIGIAATAAARVAAATATAAAAATTAATAAIRPLHATRRNLFAATEGSHCSPMPHEQQQQETQKQQQQQQQCEPAVSVSSRLRPSMRICLLGRPNVGKSSLFNRIIWGASGGPPGGPSGGARRGDRGRGGALVGPSPGTTRDILIGSLRWKEKRIEICDTGGLVNEKEEGGPLAAELRDQISFALQQAACVVLVVDGRSDDEHMAELVRHLKLPVTVCVAKCENSKTALADAQVFWKLGLGEPIPCSAITGTGVAELLDRCVSVLPPSSSPKTVLSLRPDADSEEDFSEYTRVALIGRPNAGKSRLMNCLLNSQRSLAASRADVCLLVIDGAVGISKQDIRLAEMLQAHGRAAIVIINKWDIALQTEDFNHKQAVDYVRKALDPLAWAEVLFVSAETGQNVAKIWQAVDAAVLQHRRRLTTALLNFVLRDALGVFPPPLTKDSVYAASYDRSLL
ncbi:hypothetical protein Emag_001848 [Eimeria magna]